AGEEISAPTEEQAESEAAGIIEEVTETLSEGASKAIEAATSVLEKVNDAIQQVEKAAEKTKPQKP
ncbi:MAG: hypothetical protein ACP5I1_07070, partial [Candidatus Hinthialibacter sp.]